MEGRALSDPAFPAFAAKVVPFLHVTTKITDRKYDGLLKAKGFNSFPTLAIMDAEGGVLLVVRDRSVPSFEKALATVTEWDGLQQRISAGEKGLEYALLVAEWKMGKLDYPAVKARANTLQNLEPAQKEALAQILLDAEVTHLFVESNRTKDGFEPAVKRFLAILQAGKPMPSGDAEMMFWTTLMRKAETEPVDAALYEKALAVFERLYGDKPNQAEKLQKMRNKLAEMRKGSP